MTHYYLLYFVDFAKVPHFLPLEPVDEEEVEGENDGSDETSRDQGNPRSRILRL